jgi:hypothetical protein
MQQPNIVTFPIINATVVPQLPGFVILEIATSAIESHKIMLTPDILEQIDKVRNPLAKPSMRDIQLVKRSKDA